MYVVFLPFARQILTVVLVLTASMVLAAEPEQPAQETTAVKLPPLFGNHMVLQCDMAVPIWGTATPGATVTVVFRTQTKTATAGVDGNWRILLDPLTAGGPDVMPVNDQKIEDVLVGEVWLGSGQSNMEASFDAYRGGDPVLTELSTHEYPQIRYCGEGKGWQIVSPKTCPWMSAELVTMGIRLQEELKVPVGLLCGALGNTSVADWFTEEMLKTDPVAQAALTNAWAQYNSPEQQKRRADKMAAWEKAVLEARAAGKPEPNKPMLDPQPGVYVHRMTGMGTCYAERIQPMVGYGIRGMVWDQGEQGAGLTGMSWGTLMHTLVSGWRKAWGQSPAPDGSGAPRGDFPVLYMQKPSGGGCAWEPADPVTSRAEAFVKMDAQGGMGPGVGPGREWDGIMGRSSDVALGLTNTAMVITRDLGAGMHPVNKSGYGTRAALVAKGFVYGLPVQYYGPFYERHVIEGGKVRVFFTHVGKGLAYRHGDRLQGFGLASRTGQGLLAWSWANAAIERDPATGRDTVVVSAADVPAPAAVCYSWRIGKGMADANLFNKDGLPAQTFCSSVAENL